MNIAQSLKALMSERKLSNSKLAREIHVHTSTVGNWLDGKDVKAENLETLCEYFGCSLDYLVGADGGDDGKSFSYLADEFLHPHYHYSNIINKNT